MDVRYIRDVHQQTIVILEEDDRSIQAKTKNLKYLGKYDKLADWTMDAKGHMIGKGNLLGVLY